VRRLALAVVGLGRVGLVSAAVLADAGHRVRAVDRDPAVRAAVASGRSPFPEPGLGELVAAARAAGRLTPAARFDRPEELDLVLVCVGTPPAEAGLDLASLTDALAAVGRALRGTDRRRPLLVAVRSTVPPGTSEEVLIPLLAEAAGTPPGSSWEFVHLPEFLREGQALADFGDPDRLVVGERVPGAGGLLADLFAPLGVMPRTVPLRLAETLKLVDNAWHATKVAFANELGRLAHALAVDAGRLAELFLADRRLNLSEAYLRPGEPFGGPCLGKDLAALLAIAGTRAVELPLLAAVAPSNRRHLAWLEARIRTLRPPPARLHLHGLAFKPGTGDLRGSPWPELARRLRAAGYRLTLSDPDLDPARLAADLAGLWCPSSAVPDDALWLLARDDPPPGRAVFDLRRPPRAPDAPAPAPCRRCAPPGDRSGPAAPAPTPRRRARGT